MGIKMDYYFDELEDFMFDELVYTRFALLKKMREIGEAENNGEVDNIPSFECCDFLANYAKRVDERLAEDIDIASAYDDLANELINAYMEEFEGETMHLSTLLIAADKPTVEETGIKSTDLLLSLWNNAIKLGLTFRFADIGTYTIDNTPFFLTRHQLSEDHTNTVYDIVVENMISQVEEELEK